MQLGSNPARSLSDARFRNVVCEGGFAFPLTEVDLSEALGCRPCAPTA
jgi:hypothetical protein